MPKIFGKLDFRKIQNLTQPRRETDLFGLRSSLRDGVSSFLSKLENSISEGIEAGSNLPPRSFRGIGGRVKLVAANFSKIGWFLAMFSLIL